MSANFGEFLRLLIVKAGYRRIVHFVEKVNLAPPTLYAILKVDRPEEVGAYDDTKHRIANLLDFDTWADIIAAWEIEDKGASLDMSLAENLADRVREIAGVEAEGWCIAVIESAVLKYEKRFAPLNMRTMGKKAAGSDVPKPPKPKNPPEPDDEDEGEK